MTLGFVDRAATHRTHLLPRLRGEGREVYARRFFAATRGLGNVAIVTVRGERRKVRALRGLNG